MKLERTGQPIGHHIPMTKTYDDKLVFFGYNSPMQSNKSSIKTRTSAEETVAAGPELSPKPEKTTKPRTSRSSSRAKKTEIADPVSANHHHKAAPSIGADEALAEASRKGLAVSAGGESSVVESAVIDPAGEVVSSAVLSSTPSEIVPVADGSTKTWEAPTTVSSAPAEIAPVAEASPREVTTPVAEAPAREVTNEEIAQLAHSYWLARGGANGSPEEDWLRAERELKGQR
jgi:hypothetical protein